MAYEALGTVFIVSRIKLAGTTPAASGPLDRSQYRLRLPNRRASAKAHTELYATYGTTITKARVDPMVALRYE